MKWRDWLEEWSLSELKIKLNFLELAFNPSDKDKDAAWELYIELLTRITTQRIAPDSGDEQSALTSVYSLYGLTREIIKRNGRGCSEFAKLAIVVLNQIVRPFTTKWHRLSLAGAFQDQEQCDNFREELEVLQDKLSHYTKALSNMAGVEDWTQLEIAD